MLVQYICDLAKSYKPVKQHAIMAAKTDDVEEAANGQAF